MTKSIGHKPEFWNNFKFLLENAKEIWNSIGCTDGSYKPTASNENIWKSEDWGKEVKSYYDESDKIKRRKVKENFLPEFTKK